MQSDAVEVFLRSSVGIRGGGLYRPLFTNPPGRLAVGNVTAGGFGDASCSSVLLGVEAVAVVASLDSWLAADEVLCLTGFAPFFVLGLVPPVDGTEVEPFTLFALLVASRVAVVQEGSGRKLVIRFRGP